MTTFIKAKLKDSDDRTNIDKYRVSANITESYYKGIIPEMMKQIGQF